MRLHWMGILIAGACGSVLTLVPALMPWLSALKPRFELNGVADQMAVAVDLVFQEWTCLEFLAPFVLGAATGAIYGFFATRRAEPPTTGNLALGGAISAALAAAGSGVMMIIAVFALIQIAPSQPPPGVSASSLGEMQILISVLGPVWVIAGPVIMALPGAGGAMFLTRLPTARVPQTPAV